MTRVVVLGLGITGESVTRHFAALDATVTVVEDRVPTSETLARRVDEARARGVDVICEISAASVDAVVGSADLVVPSPGVAPLHPVIAAAERAGVPVRSEIDIAADVAETLPGGGPRLLAVTGTNGKTTVTTLVASILGRSGARALAAGNIGLPLIDAIHRDIDVVVAEVSSFQLAFTRRFAPRAAAFLNVGPDHLDWHRTFDAYAEAKGRIFAHQERGDVAVFNADDPVVTGLTSKARSRHLPFSVAPGARAGYRLAQTVQGEMLVTDEDTVLLARSALGRDAPHDLANALAAAALALGNGASLDGVRQALTEFRGLDHRLQLVAEHRGVRFVDDSKATNAHATSAAVSGLHDVVLIAGGHNKGLDLAALAVLAPRLRAVVAIGDAAPDIEAVFDEAVPVSRAASMAEAVHGAAERARPGDTVLLSPACASYDWYSSYAARGDDFARCVRQLVRIG